MKKEYAIRVEQLIQYAGTIVIEAESASEAIQMALAEVEAEGAYMLEPDVDACSAYAYSVSSDDGCFSMQDARDVGFTEVRQVVACRGVESVPSALVDGAF